MKRNAHRGGRQAVFPAQKLRLRNTAGLRCMHEKRQLLPGEAPLSSRLSVRPFCTYVRSCPFVGAPFEYLYMLMPGGVSWRDTFFVVNPGWPPRVKVTRRPGGSMPETEIVLLHERRVVPRAVPCASNGQLLGIPRGFDHRFSRGNTRRSSSQRKSLVWRGRLPLLSSFPLFLSRLTGKREKEVFGKAFVKMCLAENGDWIGHISVSVLQLVSPVGRSKRRDTFQRGNSSLSIPISHLLCKLRDLFSRKVNSLTLTYIILLYKNFFLSARDRQRVIYVLLRFTVRGFFTENRPLGHSMAAFP